MPAPVPTLDQVINAIVGEMNAMNPLPGTVLHFENNLDSEIEFIEQYQDTDGSLDLWLIDAAVDSQEGRAPREIYSLFNIRIRYLTVRIDDDEWSRQALTEAERVRTELEGNADVFAIGGQRQLRVNETINYEGGFVTIEGQYLYQVTMNLVVEARRWA